MVRIPVEYQEVEYLESTGTQYIDTGYVPVEDTWVDCEHGFSDTYSGEQVILGASSSNYTGNNTTGLTVQFYNYNRWYCGCGGSIFGNVLTGVGKGLYIKHRVILTKNLLTVDGNEKGNPGHATFDPSQPCYLYAINAYGIGVRRLSTTLRLYSVKLYENENIMRDFIPCYRKSDSEPGMYDTVTKQFFTNAGTGTFIVGNDVSWDTASLIERRRQILLNTPHLETISDTMASFKTDVPALVKDCKVYFSPVQEGTGDPSPDNVRPITGWDGVTVTRCGKNLLPNALTTTTTAGITATVNDDGSITLNGTATAHRNFIICNDKITFAEKANYVFNGGADNGTGSTYRIYFEWYNYNLGIWNGSAIYSSSVPKIVNTDKIRRAMIQVYNGTTLNNVTFYPMLRKATETDATYAPYAGDTIPITFPTEAGTVYGGYVDLVKGELVETHEHCLLTKVNSEPLYASYMTETSVFFHCDTAHNFETNGEYIVTDLMCDVLKPIGVMIHTNPDEYINHINRRYLSTNRLGIVMLKSIFNITEEDSLDLMKDKITTYLTEHPIGVSYKLATPITHQLTPETIKTLKGINNIWSNTNGNIEVKFWKH